MSHAYRTPGKVEPDYYADDCQCEECQKRERAATRLMFQEELERRNLAQARRERVMACLGPILIGILIGTVGPLAVELIQAFLAR